MPEKDESADLIKTRLWALVAALYAAIVAASRTASILAHADGRLNRIHLLTEILPPFTQVVVFFLIYGVVIWRFVDALREFAGAERVYCGLFLFDLLLYPLRVFVPAAGAMCVLFVQAVTNVVMFPAAVHMFIQLGSTKQNAHPP
jgi:hypothetical protein